MKISHSVRFKGSPICKMDLKFFSEEECVVYRSDKIISIHGRLMQSKSGKKFRCLFASSNQIKYAKLILANVGWVRIKGHYQEDNVYITSLSSPLNSAARRNKLFRIREAQARDEYIRENTNTNFTGKHRSHEISLPNITKCLSVKLEKSAKEIDFMEPIKKSKKRKKKDWSDFELEEKKERRKAQLESFRYVKGQLEGGELCLAIIKMGCTPSDIQICKDVISAAIPFMSYRAK